MVGAESNNMLTTVLLIYVISLLHIVTILYAYRLLLLIRRRTYSIKSQRCGGL